MRAILMILGTFFSAFWLAILGFTVYGWGMCLFCAYVAILGALGPDSAEERIRKHRRQQLMDSLTAVSLESDDDVAIISSIKNNNGWPLI